MAMGIKQTHVKGSHIDMEFLATVAVECNTPTQIINEIKNANTARHVSEIINKHNAQTFYYLLCKKVYEQMYEHSKGGLRIEVIMFDFDGKICGKFPH